MTLARALTCIVTMADVSPVIPVVFKKRAGKSDSNRKRKATPPPDSDSEYSSDEGGVRVKKRNRGGIHAAATSARSDDLSKSTAFAGDRSAQITNLDDATKQSNWFDSDAAAKQDTKQPSAGNTTTSTDSYKGSAGYQSFIRKNPDGPKRSVGPVKGPSSIRTITVTDFAPDVCKDYKQTGFCGFGDSCKFLHEREDYKQGWQIDKEWDQATKGKKLEGTIVASANRAAMAKAKDDDDDGMSMLENIPWKCIICREDYKNPVVTKCGHYFCESCALKRHKQKGGKACAACGTDTGGTFSVAKNLRKLLDKKRERVQRRKEKAREEGLEVSSDEED